MSMPCSLGRSTTTLQHPHQTLKAFLVSYWSHRCLTRESCVSVLQQFPTLPDGALWSNILEHLVVIKSFGLCFLLFIILPTKAVRASSVCSTLNSRHGACCWLNSFASTAGSAWRLHCTLCLTANVLFPLRSDHWRTLGDWQELNAIRLLPKCESFVEGGFLYWFSFILILLTEMIHL